MLYLVNPGRRRRAVHARRRKTRPKVGARGKTGLPGIQYRKRRTKRKPPAGWSSWSAYMASIRPNPHRRGSSMARRKKRSTHRRRRSSARRSVVRRSRRRYRRNPPGIVNQLTGGAKDALLLLGGVAATQAVSRKLLEFIPAPGTAAGIAAVNVAAQAGTALALSMLAHRFAGPTVARAVLVGGLTVPIRTAARLANVPVLSSALADDVAAYPMIAGYPEGVGDYVYGPQQPMLLGPGDMGAYVGDDQMMYGQ